MLDLVWFIFDVFQFIWNEVKDYQKDNPDATGIVKIKINIK